MEEGKVGFKIDCEIKSETERERNKYPEKSKTFPSTIKKVIKMKYRRLLEKVTMGIHGKRKSKTQKVVKKRR